jgi:hypothetical protein
VIKVTNQKNAYVDVNPVIVTSDCKIVLAKRVEGIVGGGKMAPAYGLSNFI